MPAAMPSTPAATADISQEIQGATAQRDSGPKPERPAGFPLFAHRSGQWAKKIKGRTFYFGVWKGPDLALRRYLAERADLEAGRPPRPIHAEGKTVKELCNEFLTTKQAAVELGELTKGSWSAYLTAAKRLCSVVNKDLPIESLAPGDFEKLRSDMSRTWGPVFVAAQIQRIRTIFRYAVQQGYVDRPVLFGMGFQKPSRKTIRKHRAEKGLKMFEAAELGRLIEAANPTLRAMILLGVNCGLGNHDVGLLELPGRQAQKTLDLKAGWLDYPRPKTGMPRRAKLWPETIEALRKVIRGRKARAGEKNTTKALFLTKHGRPWIVATGCPISAEMTALRKRLGIGRKGLSFYGLRHTFETIGGETKDQAAVDYIMGHTPDARDMSAVYRERISDERLAAVADHVHAWLWREEKSGEPPALGEN